MNTYIDVLLPIPLKQTFTYKINKEESNFIKVGMRVSVPFGKRKLYAGIVTKIHNIKPEIYEPKDIDCIIDDEPLVLETQLMFWQWIANYYMCTYGEVLKAALPSAFLLQGETSIVKNIDANIDTSTLRDDEFLVHEALQFKSSLKIDELSKILGKKTVLPVAYSLLEKNVINIEENIKEKYTPKLEKQVILHDNLTEKDLPVILENLKNAKKQRELLLHFFKLKSLGKKITTTSLLKEAGATKSSLDGLVNKEIFKVEEKQIDRVDFSNFQDQERKALNEYQQKAFEAIQLNFQQKQVCLLHGITSSGKTEIYNKLIEKLIKENKQVLFLVPEIALTIQLIERLKLVFGKYLVVYNSRYSTNERVEAWNKVLNAKNEPLLVIGARSSIFLPFTSLGLVIVDEEHEQTYKQYDPAPRYHARDAAIVLAFNFKANVLLGSATPSIESYFNTQQGKYGLVELNKRYKNILLPEIELVDLQKKYKKKLMKAHFSDQLLEKIQECLDLDQQVIIFQNRRGFSNTQNCLECGYTPQCTQCDVSLTYHKFSKQLRCHYCGYQIAEQKVCRVCESVNLTTQGLGTEQVEQELETLFPTVKIGRMDQDTTRGKYGHQKIISAFANKEISILVGTQMLAKGLDFKNVGLVGVMNADNLLFFPDYRSHERTFQLLTQVSGRAGRYNERGKVIIQTFNPLHQILQQVSVNNYKSMYAEQLMERKQHLYPPFLRLIQFTLKHKDFNKTNEAAEWLAKSLKNSFGNYVLGPEAPSVSRVRNQYIKNILLKVPKNQNINKVKEFLGKTIKTIESIKNYNGVRIIINVDTI